MGTLVPDAQKFVETAEAENIFVVSLPPLDRTKA